VRWTTRSAHHRLALPVHRGGAGAAQDPSGEPIRLRAPVASVGTPWASPLLPYRRLAGARLEPVQRDPASARRSYADSAGSICTSAARYRPQVRTWQRAFGHLPVGALLPDATAVPAVARSASSPGRLPVTPRAGPHRDVAITAGLRYDQFDCSDLPGEARGTERSVSRICHLHRAPAPRWWRPRSVQPALTAVPVARRDDHPHRAVPAATLPSASSRRASTS
jgi:hypothetical protein